MVGAFKGKRCPKLLQAVSEASLRLDRHHGSASGMVPPGSKEASAITGKGGGKAPRHKKQFWLCLGKDCKGEACGYMVPCGRIACDACGHQPPLHVSRPDGAKSGKSAGKGNGNGSGSRSSGTGATTLEKQLKAELEASKQELAKVKKLAAAEAVKTDAAAAGAPHVTSNVAMASDEANGGSDLGAKVEQAKATLKKWQDLPYDMRGAIAGGYESHIAGLEKALEVARAAQRAAKPLKIRLEDAEAFQGRAAKRAENAKAHLQTQEAELAELSKRIELQRAEVAEKDAENAEAIATVATLATQFAEERSLPPPLAGSGGSPFEGDEALKAAVADLCTFAGNAGVQQALVAAGMPEAQQTRVVAALGTIGKSEKAEALQDTALAAGAAAEMELDEEFLDEMAEAAVPNGGESGVAADERPFKVAEAKVRLKTKAENLAKVRKIGKKTST